MQLKGKRVYITGGDGGIGTPLVQKMRDAGADVIVHSFGFFPEALEVTARYLRDNTPDVLINMAGFNVLDYCENQNLQAIIDANMMAPMILTQAVLPKMKARNSGQIVSMGSMTSLIPLPHLTGYVAAKAGLKGFNDSLRRELSGTHIAVTHIVPRAVKTEMNNGVKGEVNSQTKVNYDDPDKVAEKILQAILSGTAERRIGWPERIFAIINAVIPKVIDMGLTKNREIGEVALNKIQAAKQL